MITGDLMAVLAEILKDIFFKICSDNVLREMFVKVCNVETLNYLLFGVLTTIVSYVSYFIAQKLLSKKLKRERSIMIANVISWILAVAFAYVTNKLFVFQSVSWDLNVILKEIPAFVGARLFSFGFEMVWMWLTAVKLKQNDKVCKLLGQVAITIMNYFFSKLFIFR